MLAWAGEWKDAELLARTSTAPLRGVATERDGRRSLLAANLQADPVAVRLEGLPARVTLRRLNDETAPDWSEPQALDGVSTLELGAYETVRADA